jgi:hypothetical protein
MLVSIYLYVLGYIGWWVVYGKVRIQSNIKRSAADM